VRWKLPIFLQLPQQRCLLIEGMYDSVKTLRKLRGILTVLTVLTVLTILAVLLFEQVAGMEILFAI